VRKLGMIAAVAAALLMMGVGVPATASAQEECPHRFGAPQRLVDAGGAVVQEWTVTDLRHSADPRLVIRWRADSGRLRHRCKRCPGP
jgi:hypothetical protein